MPATELNDNEIAVTIDSLAATRNHLRSDPLNRAAGAEPPPTPNIDSALGKIKGLVDPGTYSLIVTTSVFAVFSDHELEVLVCALDEESEGRWTDVEHAEAVERLRALAEVEVQSRPDLLAQYEDDE